MKLESRYGEYFPKYFNYFGIPLRLNNSMHEGTNHVKVFADELTNGLIDETRFKYSQCQISVYYKMHHIDPS